MSNGDITIPPTDLTSAAIDAVNLLLSELGISPLDILESLFSGRPKFEDTDSVIAAYNQSAYWPLHALASDLQIAAKNGAPISDSNPAIQKQFGVWKQGTVTSIQTFAGGEAGPGQPGYWTIFALIEDSWKASQDGEQAVLQYVKALDALTQVLAQQNQKPPPPPVVPPPPGPPQPVPGPLPTGGGGGQPTCPPYTELPDCLQAPGAVDQSLDEVGQGFAGVAYWLQILTIYVMNIFQAGAGGMLPQPPGTPVPNPSPAADPVTCTQLTGLFDQLITAIGAITITVPPPPPPPGPPPPIDLTAIDADLKAIAAALSSGGDTATAEIKRLADSNDAADALGLAVAQHWATIYPGDPGTTQLATS